MRAFVTDDIVPGTIDANMGGGGPVGPGLAAMQHQ